MYLFVGRGYLTSKPPAVENSILRENAGALTWDEAVILAIVVLCIADQFSSR